MRDNIIEDQREYYLNHRKELHEKILHKKRAQLFCDAYFISGETYAQIALIYGVSEYEVAKALITACGAMIRYRYGSR